MAPSREVGSSDLQAAGRHHTKAGRLGTVDNRKQARHYAKCPPSWSIPEVLSLPYPESFSGFLGKDMGGGVSLRIKEL